MIKFFILLTSLTGFFLLESKAVENQANLQPYQRQNAFPKLHYKEALRDLYSFTPLMNTEEIEFERPKVYLKLKSVSTTQTLRTVKLNLMSFKNNFSGEGKDIKKRRSEKSDSAETCIGKIILLENPFLLNHKGAFHLDLLYIFDDFQGKGLGGIALTELKKMAIHLAHYSAFYQTITLISQDVDYKGQELPVVPRRVKFYMDNGFHLHDKAKELIKFLSIKHFIDQLDESQLTHYLQDYILPESVESLAFLLAPYVLPALQQSSSFKKESLDYLIEWVRTDSSLCAKHILDRAYYWGNGITDEEQETFVKYVYLMSYSLSLKQETFNPLPDKTFNIQQEVVLQEALTESCQWKDYNLLPGQNRLNQEIDRLIRSPTIYFDTPGTKLFEELKFFLNFS